MVKKDGLILENHLIPLHHALSLFLPGKLHLSFLAILRKEGQVSKTTIYNHIVYDKHTILYKQQQEIPDISMPNQQMDF